MYKKIGQSVSENPQADGQSGPKAKIAPTYKTTNAHQRIKKKKVIVSFPPTAVVFMVITYLWVNHAINSIMQKVVMKINIQSTVVIVIC